MYLQLQSPSLAGPVTVICDAPGTSALFFNPPCMDRQAAYFDPENAAVAITYESKLKFLVTAWGKLVDASLPNTTLVSTAEDARAAPVARSPCE